MTSVVMNSDTQSSHHGGSSNGPWDKIMTLMEKMMTAMKIRSPVMAFRTSCVVGETGGGAGGAGGGPVGTRLWVLGLGFLRAATRRAPLGNLATVQLLSLV